jgi:hypothetical protein
VLQVALLVFVAGGVSFVASPLAGGVILAVGLVLVVSYEATRPSGLLRAAEHAAHLHGGRDHVVVVADAPLAGDDLADALSRVAGPDAQLDVLAPMLVSHLHYATSDTTRLVYEAALRRPASACSSATS